MISNIFEKYFLLYAEENEIPFTKFVQFFRDFKIFPDFINMCTLKLLFLILTKDSNAQNQSVGSDTADGQNDSQTIHPVPR